MLAVVDLALMEAIALTLMGAWLVVIGGVFVLSGRVDRASSLLLVLAGAYAILWQEPTLLGFGPESVFHVSLAQPVFLFLLSGAVFLWAYWLFQEHVGMLEEASEDLSDALTVERTLIDILSHDLRNHLTTAQTRLSQVDRGVPYEEHAPQISRSLDRIETTIANSLLYSRLTVGKNLETEPLNLVDLSQAALETLDAQAHSEGITLELDAPRRIEAEVTPLLQHAVENLVANAIKFSPAGSQVTVRVAAHDGTARIQVEDDGPGLPSERAEELFERFSRGEGEVEDGAGLGLAIVERLARIHDGTVNATSTPSGGTRIDLTLPSHPEQPINERPRPRRLVSIPEGSP